jgi:hypothetical protein
MGVRWFPYSLLQQLLPAVAVEALRRTQLNSDIKVISQAVTVRSDDAGVFAAYSEDLIVQFLDNDVVIATSTIHGVLDTGAGEFTLTNTASTGETTTVAYYGNITDSARAEVRHAASDKIAAATFSAVDQSVGGSTPGTISEGGGGGGGGGSK